jgi:predicted kinase
MRSLHLARPRAIMMVGVPGSGKSFFASQFSQTFSTPFIDSETITAITNDRAISGRIIALLLTEICKTNQTFILEGNSETKVLRAEFAEFAKKHGYDPLFVWVQADPSISRQRSAKKGRNQESYESTMQRFEAPTESERALVVSGRHTYATQLRMVLNHIGNDNRPPVVHERQPSPVVPVRKRIQ